MAASTTATMCASTHRPWHSHSVAFHVFGARPFRPHYKRRLKSKGVRRKEKERKKRKKKDRASGEWREMQVWPKAGCCDVRTTQGPRERERGRKEGGVGGGEMVFVAVCAVALGHGCMCTHTKARRLSVDIMQFGRSWRFLQEAIVSNKPANAGEQMLFLKLFTQLMSKGEVTSKAH